MAAMSPWGQIDHIQKTDKRGVCMVSTPSHGGLRLSKGVVEKELPENIRTKYGRLYGNYYFFEEDAEWAIPVYVSEAIKNAVKPLFTKPVGVAAHSTIKKYFPELLKTS